MNTRKLIRFFRRYVLFLVVLASIMSVSVAYTAIFVNNVPSGELDNVTIAVSPTISVPVRYNTVATMSFSVTASTQLKQVTSYRLGHGCGLTATALPNITVAPCSAPAYVISPYNAWYDFNFLFRRPYLAYLNGSSAYLSFVNTTDVYKNWSTYGGLLVTVGNSSTQVVVNASWGIIIRNGGVKVGIKPSSFGGTGDYVMIEVNGTWIQPVNGSVESGVSGEIINATFTLDPNYVWVIQAVGMHHTNAGWSDPTVVYVWDSEGNLLHTYTASAHTWDNTIYDGTNYFEYVTIDNYQVPQDVIKTTTLLRVYMDLTPFHGYHYIYVYYGGTPAYNVTGVTANNELKTIYEAGIQTRPATQATITTTTSAAVVVGGGAGGVVAGNSTYTPTRPHLNTHMNTHMTLPPLTPPQAGLPPAANVGLGIIIMSVAGAALYSEIRRRRKIPTLFRARYRYKPVKWGKRTKKWWEE